MSGRWEGPRWGDLLSPDARRFVIALIVIGLSFYGLTMSADGTELRGMYAGFITLAASFYLRGDNK